MGKLTTHILDTASGRPAAGVRIKLFNLDRDTRSLVTTATTNADGRIDGALAEGESFGVGEWELVFHVGDYFQGTDLPATDPPFLNEVVVRFGSAEPDGHYHVPLLVSPFGYSTYRGS